MVNAIALDGATSSVSILDFTWTLQAAGCAWRFRNSKQSIAQTWAKAVEAALAKPAESYAWLRPSGGDSRTSSSGDVDARRQPCLIRTSDDLLELTRTWEDEDVSTMLLDEKLEATSVHRALEPGRRVEAALGRRGRDRCRPPLGLRERPSANGGARRVGLLPANASSTRRLNRGGALQDVSFHLAARITTGPWSALALVS